MKEGLRRAWLVLPQSLRELPADLAAILGFVVLTNAFVFVPVLNETPGRIIVGLVFVLFAPGYAFIAALFPEEGEPPHADADSDDEEGWVAGRDRGIDGIERVALSFGLSIAVVPLIGLVLNFTPWGIRLVPIMLAVSAFTAICVGVAAVRRWELPPQDRFAVPYRAWIAAGRAEVFEPDDRVDAALNVALALSIVLAIGVVGYAIAVPPQGEQFTEFYILTEDEDDELVAANYPTDFELGEAGDIVLGVSNQEHESTNYTVVVQLQEVEFDRDGGGNITNVTVTDYDELHRFDVTLAHNETWHHSHEIEPTFAGEDLRVQYLLYVDEAPDEPTLENSYRDVHLWIDVEE